LHRKGLAIGILILMLGVNIGSTFAGDADITTMSPVVFDGNTLYVGGSGPNNYTKIQDAIDNASDGDTVFVYGGTYYENLNVNKSIMLEGEDNSITIIDGKDKEYVVEVSVDGVTVNHFTITGPNYVVGGLFVHSSHNIISNNIMSVIDHGIIIEGGKKNIVNKNNLNKGPSIGGLGISLISTNNNTVSNNTITGKYHTGIFCFNCDYPNLIIGNIITDSYIEGILIEACTGIIRIEKNHIATGGFDSQAIGIRIGDGIHSVILNSIESNYIGVAIIGDICKDELNVQVSQNNFRNNIHHAFFAVYPKHLSGPQWFKNYWEEPRLAPKMIVGLMLIKTLPFLIFLPWVMFDWRPAREPYEIS